MVFRNAESKTPTILAGPPLFPPHAEQNCLRELQSKWGHDGMPDHHGVAALHLSPKIPLYCVDCLSAYGSSRRTMISGTTSFRSSPFSHKMWRQDSKRGLLMTKSASPVFMARYVPYLRWGPFICVFCLRFRDPSKSRASAEEWVLGLDQGCEALRWPHCRTVNVEYLFHYR